MKKRTSLVFPLILLLLLSGCGDSPGGNAEKINDRNNLNTVDAVLEEKMAEASDVPVDPDILPAEDVFEVSDEPGDPGIPDEPEEPEVPDEEEDPESPEQSTSGNGVDLDLTELSATMVYSEVFNMMMEPEKYMGKTIRMEGMYTVYFDEETEKRYHACIISDATACCSQGIEFELTSDYSYPDDYPEEAADICVVGTFDTYNEGGSTYCTLRNARLEQSAGETA